MSQDFPQSLRLASMLPLDSKNSVSTLDELKQLGENNNKAFSYYRGLIVYCNENKTRYEWTDDLYENGIKKEVLLDNDFKYPRGTKVDDIDYSNKIFNFVKYKQDFSIKNTDNTIVFENGILNSNVSKAKQTSIIVVNPELEYFPLRVPFQKKYTNIERVVVNTNEIPEPFLRYYHDHLLILDYRDIAMVPQAEELYITIHGTFFLNNE